MVTPLAGTPATETGATEDARHADDSRAALDVLFATDGCAVSLALALLTGQECTKDLYVISYAWNAALGDLFGASGSGDPVHKPENAQWSASAWTAKLLRRRPVVRFCLLGHTPGAPTAQAKVRVRPVFVCVFSDLAGTRALSGALLHGDPLPAHVAGAHLDVAASFAFHTDMILALFLRTDAKASSGGRDGSGLELLLAKPTGRSGLLQLYLHHEQQTVAAYRRRYNNYTVTPFWFVNKFGPSEKNLVLTARFYLFQTADVPVAQSYDLQAIRDFARTYAVRAPANPSGLTLQDLASFGSLARFCAQSAYARGPVADLFPAYVAARIRADTAEISLLSEYISHDRRDLRVSDSAFVTYIYLAYFEGFNRRQLRNHLAAVTVRDPSAIAAIAGASRLGARTISVFFRHVRAQLNIRDYVAKNVRPNITVLSAECAREYVARCTYAPLTRKPSSPEPPVVAAYGSATEMRALVDAAESRLRAHGWIAHLGAVESVGDELPRRPEPYVSAFVSTAKTCCVLSRRLLAIAATPPLPGRTVDPLRGLLGLRNVEGPAPVYRVALPSDRQAFAVMPRDDWGSITVPVDMSAEYVARAEAAEAATHGGTVTSPRARIDARLTDFCQIGRGTCGTRYPRLAAAYVNRNELVNADLAISNVVLDVDLHITRPVPTMTLFVAMRGFRAGVIAALPVLFPAARAEWAAYPCYFYKSACPPRSSAGSVASGTDADSNADDFTGCEPCSPPSLESTLVEDYVNDTSLLSMDCEDYIGDEAMDSAVTTRPTSTPSPDPTSAAVQPDVPDAHADAASASDACGCDRKIGFRVVFPVPAPYLLSGPDTLKGVARILQQAVLLERGFLEPMHSYLRDFAFVDTGVYTHGHSLRLPFFYKISEWGQAVGRLLPFYIVPETCADLVGFLRAHGDPDAFHLHAKPRDSATEPRTHILHQLDGDYVTFFERKAEHRKARFLSRRPTLETALRSFRATLDDEADLSAFVLSVVLTKILAYLEAHFPGRPDEYCSAGAQVVVRKAAWVLVQLLPGGGGATRYQPAHVGFACLRYNHLRGARNRARTFVALSVNAHNQLCASLCQQCFATKCDSNQMKTVFTVELAPE